MYVYAYIYIIIIVNGECLATKLTCIYMYLHCACAIFHIGMIGLLNFTTQTFIVQLPLVVNIIIGHR